MILALRIILAHHTAPLSVEYVLACQCKKFIFNSNFHFIEKFTDILIGMYQVLKRTSKTHCFNWENSVSKTEDLMDNCFTNMYHRDNCIMEILKGS